MDQFVAHLGEVMLGNRWQENRLGERGRSNIVVSTTLQRADLFWMNQDSWAARGGLVAGVLWLVVGTAGPDPAGNGGFALAVIGFCVVALPVYGMWLTNAFGLAGQTVHLHVDDVGVRGWPRVDDADRTWARAHRVWTRPGVVIIQFGWLIGSRGGRIVIPRRDLGPRQAARLWAILIARGLVRADRRSTPRRVLDRLAGWIRSR